MIVVQNLNVRQGAFSLEGISFEIAAGRFAALMGRTGSGKTTILEIIAGLRPLHGGRVLLDGRDVATLAPGQRRIGYVPQDLALFTTMTVREHLAFSLRVHRWPLEKINPRVRELAELLGLAHLMDRKPHGLSGGESQRVALGRALAYHPRILLLDEPLSALDDATREEMYALLRRVQQQTGVTTLHVTHNRAEATALANDLIVLENGSARQTNCHHP